MDLMNQEINLIDSQKQQWKDALGVELKRIIENNSTLYQKRAGRIFSEEIQNQRYLLDDLLSQAATIEIELLEAQRAEYEFRAQNLDALGDQSKFAIDFAPHRTSFTGHSTASSGKTNLDITTTQSKALVNRTYTPTLRHA